MKNTLRFVLVVLAFATTGLLAQAAVAPTAISNQKLHQSAKLAKKAHKKHKKHKKGGV